MSGNVPRDIPHEQPPQEGESQPSFAQRISAEGNSSVPGEITVPGETTGEPRHEGPMTDVSHLSDAEIKEVKACAEYLLHGTPLTDAGYPPETARLQQAWLDSDHHRANAFKIDVLQKYGALTRDSTPE